MEQKDGQCGWEREENSTEMEVKEVGRGQIMHLVGHREDSGFFFFNSRFIEI